MKKQAAFLMGLTLACAAFSTSAVSAQSALRADASTSAEMNTGGGLGTGLNYMVKSILGESSLPEAAPAPAPTAAMMMNANTAADARLAPQANTMSRKSALTFSAEAAVAPMTKEDLHAYIREIMREDSRIQSVDTAESHVRITYAVPTKVLGFMRVFLKITAGAYASGGTQITYPWYSFAASHMSADFKTRVAEQVEPLIVSESFSIEEQKTLIDAIHASLAGEFESSTGGGR